MADMNASLSTSISTPAEVRPPYRETDEPLQVVTAADRGYVRYLAGLVSSLQRGPLQTRPLALTIISRGYDAPLRSQVEALLQPPHTIHWIEPTEALLVSLAAPQELARLSPAYFRLLLPFVLSAHSRAIYLDADTLVRADLAALGALDLEGHAVAATRDYLPCVADAVGNWRELGLDPRTLYFCSGVMVADLPLWRARRIAECVLEVCQVNSDFLIAQGKYVQNDQYGLNVVLHGDWREIDRSWNHAAFLPPANEHIIHFIGHVKPHSPACHPAFQRLFLDLLKGTPFE